VVGFKKEIIMEMYPQLLYVYNPLFIQTNTAKSLLAAMESIAEDDVVWLNGDTVFTEGALKCVMETPGNVVAVEFREVGEEEVKFTVDDEGYVREISKSVKGGLGEAVGINKIERDVFGRLQAALARCDSKDYFERALEICIKEGVRFKAVSIGQGQCVEVDFVEDLERAWKIVGNDQEIFEP
jgi:choline kinase